MRLPQILHMQTSHPSRRIREARRAAAYARWSRWPEPEPTDQPLDCRQPFDLLLKSAGGADWHIEPCLGLIAWRAVNLDTGRVEARAALKTLLRQIADGLPRTLSARSMS